MYLLYESGEYWLHIEILNDLTQHHAKVLDGPYKFEGDNRECKNSSVLVLYKGYYGAIDFMDRYEEETEETDEVWYLEINTNIYYITQQGEVGLSNGNAEFFSSTTIQDFNEIWERAWSKIPKARDFGRYVIASDLALIKKNFSKSLQDEDPDYKHIVSRDYEED